MQPAHNRQNSSVPVYLDYDLVSLSNTMIQSFEEGLRLASSMLNAPFFITNLYDYVIISSESIEIDDPAWDRIAETRFCYPASVAESKNIYSVMIPNIGKMIYWSASEPTTRQRQLAVYIAWIVSLFGEEKFHILDSNSDPKSMLLFYLVNEWFDGTEDRPSDFLTSGLPKKMQVLACFHNTLADNCTVDISKICDRTEYVTVYKQKYRIFLSPSLSSEQIEALSELLSRHNIYAGLSYPFDHYKECRDHAIQAIVALNETAKQGWKEHLAQYEDLFALDVLYNYSSDVPLSNFRHPLFLCLEEYDRLNDTELSITLMAYISNSGNTQETAKQLSMHRNTVLYRLRQITEIAGYNIQDPSCRASLLYAMTVERSLKKSDR